MQNILPKDIILYIYRILHYKYTKELNNEFLNSTQVYCDNDNLYWVLVCNGLTYNVRYLNDFLCEECVNANILDYNECAKCTKIQKCYYLSTNLPNKYIYSSGMSHPYAYKQRHTNTLQL